MKGRPVAVSIALVVAACTPLDGDLASDTRTSASSSTVPAPSTSTSVGVPPEISFGAVDRGVLAEFRLVERTEELQPAPTGASGDRISLTGCRITWFGEYEFEFEWVPGNELEVTERRTVGLGFIAGDTAWAVAAADIVLDGPGRFVISLSNLDVFHQDGDEETTGDTRIIDDPSAFMCLVTVEGPEPVEGEATMSVPLSVDLRPPDPLHPPDSIQGVVERMDPSDPTEVYRPLAALAAYLPRFPIDVVYVIPDVLVDSLTLEIEGACVDLSSGYGDGTYINQHTGCLDGRHQGLAVDEVWSVDTPGGIVAELQPLRWWGHPGVSAVLDDNDYLDSRDLPDGANEIYRVRVDETLVSVVRFVAEDGIVTFGMEGVGDNSAGGGFPGEAWDGCYQVQYQDSGYSMVVVADSSWIVTADGRPVEIVDVGDVGVAVISEVITQPSQLEIETTVGQTPECLGITQGQSP